MPEVRDANLSVSARTSIANRPRRAITPASSSHLLGVLEFQILGSRVVVSGLPDSQKTLLNLWQWQWFRRRVLGLQEQREGSGLDLWFRI